MSPSAIYALGAAPLSRLTPRTPLSVEQGCDGGELELAAPSRLPWMKLLARVFRVDISLCSRCSGPMRVIRAVTTPQDIAAEFRGARPPPRPSPVGQLLLFSVSYTAP